jgi:multidrug/hemolysin transport system permease protein
MATMVEDKNNNISKDFLASPLKRSTLASGYIISGFLISLILTLITFILGEGYIVLYGGELLSIQAMLKVILLIIFTTTASSFMKKTKKTRDFSRGVYWLFSIME